MEYSQQDLTALANRMADKIQFRRLVPPRGAGPSGTHQVQGLRPL